MRFHIAALATVAALALSLCIPGAAAAQPGKITDPTAATTRTLAPPLIELGTPVVLTFQGFDWQTTGPGVKIGDAPKDMPANPTTQVGFLIENGPEFVTLAAQVRKDAAGNVYAYGLNRFPRTILIAPPAALKTTQ